MKSLKRSIIFYFIICLLFFVLDPVWYILIKWARENNLGMTMALGSFIIPPAFFIFCCIGFSSIIVACIYLKKHSWKAFIPFFMIIVSILIYIILPKTEYSIWYEIIKFYF